MFFTGCSKPTYPKDKLSESTQKILKKEYNLDGKIKLVGATLYLEVDLPELISTEKDLPGKILKKLNGAILTIVRISLSSDAKIDTLITVAKVKDYDFCVRIIQRLDDIKGLLYLKISKSDYEDRSILEMLPYSGLNYTDLTLKEFAARLLVSQYNMLLKTNPFVSALLNNVSLEFSNFTEDSIVLVTGSSQINLTASIKKFFEKILIKSYLDILKKYDIFNFPESIKIMDKNYTSVLVIKPR
ncbi:MAG: hypothetical protein V1833_05735 [Elusimicrobiota bacterium]